MKLILPAATLALGLAIASSTTANAAVPKQVGQRAAASYTAIIHKSVTWAYAGDSTTAMPSSWAHRITDKTLTRVGGFASAGFTSGQVLGGIQPGTADVLVVMVGVNDLRLGISTSTILTHISAIVTKFGGAKYVLLSAIVPSNITDYGVNHLNRQMLGEQFNAAEKSFAAQQGWYFADPDTDFRTSKNAYRAGSDLSDGVHPNARGFTWMAERLSTYIHLATSR